MKRSNRLAWLGAIALAVVILLTLIAAPSSKILSGSTYSRAPDGYGAWYAYMQKQGVSIQRWEKPFSNLTAEKRPVTLLQINGQLSEPSLYTLEKEWVEAGNTLVILGTRGLVSAANFSTLQKSPVGDVKIETRRRKIKGEENKASEKISLGDRFGAIVWEEQQGKGKVIFSSTPYLAANAYQDYLSNFKYLAQLVSNNNNKIYVDEYIHGYKDRSLKSQGKGGSYSDSDSLDEVLSYFAKTPLFPAFLQTVVLLLVLIWAQNRRFGKPKILDTPVVDNSQAYIQALAAVLQKAGSSDFVVEMVGKEEQLQLQKALGLGQIPLEHDALIQQWVQQTGASPAELDALLKLQSQNRRISERELLNWLGKWQSLREIQNSKLNV